jgi:hypothetical protein
MMVIFLLFRYKSNDLTQYNQFLIETSVEEREKILRVETQKQETFK